MIQYDGEDYLLHWIDLRSSGKEDLANYYAKTIRRSDILDVDKTGETFTIPDVFQLESAYPNPFNGRFSFDYRVSEPGLIGFQIFDISGRLIKDDLIHSINKPLKNTNTNYSSSFFAQNDWLEGEPFLEFTRHSESEGVQETGVYQRIKYVLEDGRIERYSTDSLLSEYNTSPITLLVEVDSVNVIAFKEKNYNFWPVDESLNLPKFLEITLQFKDDVFQKTFLVDD